MMSVMEVKEAYNNVRFLVANDDEEYLALQLVERVPGDDNLYANQVIHLGDLVLVCEIPHFLSGPVGTTHPEDRISHIILGVIPPSDVADIKPGLVAP